MYYIKIFLYVYISQFLLEYGTQRDEIIMSYRHSFDDVILALRNLNLN